MSAVLITSILAAAKLGPPPGRHKERAAPPGRPSRLHLAEHLLTQGASRAAALVYGEDVALRAELLAAEPARAQALELSLERAAAARLARAEAGTRRGEPAPFAAAAERVRLVADAPSVAAFARQVQERVRECERLAAEPGATSPGPLGTAGTAGACWTVALDAEWKPDFASRDNHPPSLLQLASDELIWLALELVLVSPFVRLLGFGFQSDLDKLHSGFGVGNW
ncbi:hypothetical protein T492DRAFT_883238 [Pavlovales sp. CCMP2436]|nr:hypothetical protein T492DRAFT_883238 [Pavlovales sp. CCMP2436]